MEGGCPPTVKVVGFQPQIIMMETNNWLTSKEAAKHLSMNEVHFRRTIIPRMLDMGIEGITKLSNARNSPWRVKVSALDDYMARERAPVLQGDDVSC